MKRLLFASLFFLLPITAFAVPNKGEDEYAIRRATQDVCKILGYNKMIFKGDQEPALRTFMERVKMMCGDQCVLEESPVGSPRAMEMSRMQLRESKGNSER